MISEPPVAWADKPKADKNTEPNPKCKLCGGLGKTPYNPRRPAIFVEGGTQSAARALIPWQFCRKCQKAKNKDKKLIRDLAEKETRRLEAIALTNRTWEGRLNGGLIAAASRHASLHVQASSQVGQKQALAAEATAAYLQKMTKSLALTPTRPEQCVMVIVKDTQSYIQLLNVCKKLPEFKRVVNWDLSSQLASFGNGRTTVFDAGKFQGTPIEHFTVSCVAMRQISMLTANRASDWLTVGFAYQTEDAVLRNGVRMSYVRYMKNATPLSPNWSGEIKKYAAARKLREWNDVFRLSLRDYQPVDHLAAYSMAAFLMRGDAKRFVAMSKAIAEGKNDAQAIEAAYEMPIAKLQEQWIVWLNRQ